ncbi:protein BRANCHLESS TRICHOME-like [Gossypium arboreum]|uniref:Branchless trichomes n=1 Tax=Gossypium arboreum TaxID=29729 RepID=I3QNV5_GOSAR|nr:protein BRANCHLESS TRICHOME-like [Gossypium arboreum]AFK13153.1 branchless trichomes [Gossypium arboreum]
MKGEDMKDMLLMMKNWKLYENPFYYSNHQQLQCQSSKHLHHQLIPVMDSELGIARAQIIDLKAEVEYERKARKKVESLNKKLGKEVAEERRGKEALESVCEKLAREITSKKSEMDRMKREFEEERKMLKIAEVLREERVQMKLAEAKILFHEKLKELEETKRKQSDIENNSKAVSDSRESTRFASSEQPSSCYQNINEFPKVVRAIGSKSRRWGSKLECQKAQLRINLSPSK